MIKLAIISLLLVGCVHAAPVATPTPAPRLNPVCAMIAFHAPNAKCSDADDAQHERGIVRVEIDSGVKFCWPTYDQNGYGCATLAFSKAEAAQAAIQQYERERAKQEADKAKAEPAKPETTKALVPPVAKTTIPVKGAPKP